MTRLRDIDGPTANCWPIDEALTDAERFVVPLDRGAFLDDRMARGLARDCRLVRTEV